MITKIFDQNKIKENLLSELNGFTEDIFDLHDLILKTFESKNFIIKEDLYLEKNKEDYIQFVRAYEKNNHQVEEEKSYFDVKENLISSLYFIEIE